MKVSDLLRELETAILRSTSDVISDDGGGFQLWTRPQLVTYLNAAQDKFAKETNCLLDGRTEEVTTVEIVPGVTDYKLHGSVLDVVSASIDKRRLRSASLDDLEYVTDDRTHTVPAKLLGRSKVSFFVTDSSEGFITFYPEPEEAQTARLRVTRLPLTRLEVPVEGEEETPLEIPHMYHLLLTEWAAYLALRNHDTDAENIPKATTHRNEFERELSSAKLKYKRKRQAPITFGGRAIR